MTDIQFLHDLRADLAALDEPTPNNDQPRPRRIPPAWTALGIGCVAAALAIAMVVLVQGLGGSGDSSTAPGGSQPTTVNRDLLPGEAKLLALPPVPFGHDPFFHGGRDVSISEAQRIFQHTIRFNAGPLVEANSPAANPTNRIHIWMGPFGRRQKVFIFEYQSGIRLDVSPLTRIPYHMTTAQIRSAFTREVAQDPAKLLHLATINGLPALVSHGNGKVIPIPHGSESMNGTSVTLFLNHLSIQVSANHTVPETQVLAAASSLAPISTIG